MSNATTEPHEGGHSPWGRIQDVEPIVKDVWSVSTPGHGGLKLSRRYNARMPAYMRSPGGWYEEDIRWSLPVLVFAAEFADQPKLVQAAHETAKNWHPVWYERFTGHAVPLAESSTLRRRAFERANEDNWIGRSARSIDGGEVRVVAVRGCNRQVGDPERTYIVAGDRYDARSPYGYIIDESLDESLDDAIDKRTA